MTWAQIKALDPCLSERDAVRRLLKAKFPDYQTRALTLQDAADAGVSLNNLIWIAGRADERKGRLFAADCAARVSHLTTDPRSHEAIQCARLFARGEISAERLSAAWGAAWAAWDAARAAWGAAWATATAAARDAEQQWQRARLLAWFSDHEPEDWPIAGLKEEAA